MVGSREVHTPMEEVETQADILPPYDIVDAENNGVFGNAEKYARDVDRKQQLASFSPVAPIKMDPWQIRIRYQKDDSVHYNGRTYECNIQHVSVQNWNPSAATAIWMDSGPIAASATPETLPETCNECILKQTQIRLHRVTKNLEVMKKNILRDLHYGAPYIREQLAKEWSQQLEPQRDCLLPGIVISLRSA